MDGADIHDAPRQAHRNIGYLGDFVGLYDALSVRRCLLHAAAAAKVPGPQRAEHLERAVERLRLGGFLDALAGQLSRGQRQRLAIAQAIIHQPAFLVLDEPAAGLDPEARSRLSELIVELRDGGTTILVSSHILAELEDYCTEMVVLDDGRLIETERSAPDRQTYRVTFSKPGTPAGEDLIRVISALSGLEAVSCQDGAAVIVTTRQGNAEAHEVLRALIGAELPVASFAPEAWRLQDSYLAAMDTRVSSTTTGRR